jgi:hypothetical protein
MANYLIWDCNVRDLVEALDGSIATTTTVPSAQRAGIILKARCFNIYQPQFGIGYNSQVLGGNTSQAAFQLNRCISQIVSDKGSASWQTLPNPPDVQFDFSLTANYSQ